MKTILQLFKRKHTVTFNRAHQQKKSMGSMIIKWAR